MFEPVVSENRDEVVLLHIGSIQDTIVERCGDLKTFKDLLLNTTLYKKYKDTLSNINLVFDAETNKTLFELSKEHIPDSGEEGLKEISKCLSEVVIEAGLRMSQNEKS